MKEDKNLAMACTYNSPYAFFLGFTGIGEGPEVKDVMMIMMIWIISSSLTQCNGTNDIKCPSQRHRCCHSFTAGYSA